MATEGVPFSVPDQRILDAIRKCKGVGTKICEILDISYPTFIAHIKNNPKFTDILHAERQGYTEGLCDASENALEKAVKQDKELSQAISAAKFFLNNIGKKRGYSPIPDKEINLSVESLGPLKEMFERISHLQQEVSQNPPADGSEP